MSRKHYESLAKVNHAAMVKAYAGNHSSATCDILRDVILAQADAFAADNPRFDRSRFLLASGLTIAGWVNTYELNR